MTSIAVRKSGSAKIISIPKPITDTLGIETGTNLDLTVEEGRIILTPPIKDITLDMFLNSNPKSCFEVTEEDREWIDSSVGKEIF